MYGFIRELPCSQSFPPTGFIPKTFRSKIDFFKCNKLPPIKEEEGNVGQIDIKLRNFPLGSQTSNNRNYKRYRSIDKKNSYGENEKKNLIGEEWAKSEISSRSSPSLVNINCMMNIEMKQQSIWKTSFGKRLINGKTTIPEAVSLPTIKNPKEDDEKLKESRSSSLMNSSGSIFNSKNIQLGAGSEIIQSKKKKTKLVQVPKKFRKTKKQKRSKKQIGNTENNSTKAEADRIETSLETDLPSSEFSTGSQEMSLKSKDHKRLSLCVQNILEGVTPEYNCKYCDEIFPKVEELNSHLEKHEKEKEICVLCRKIFYNLKEFTEHLLTHESVDKFSCKICKKYFPSLKKYNSHMKNVHLKNVNMKNVHLKSLKLANAGIVSNMEPTKEQMLKYICKRCQLELDTEENLREHRRHHIRFDLMAAYLLSNKSMLEY